MQVHVSCTPLKPLSLSALKALVPIEDLLTSCLSSLFEDGVELSNFVACVHYLSLSSFSEAYVYYLFHIQLFPNVIKSLDWGACRDMSYHKLLGLFFN
jgi:hypothetical protein